MTNKNIGKTDESHSQKYPIDDKIVDDSSLKLILDWKLTSFLILLSNGQQNPSEEENQRIANSPHGLKLIVFIEREVHIIGQQNNITEANQPREIDW